MQIEFIFFITTWFTILVDFLIHKNNMSRKKCKKMVRLLVFTIVLIICTIGCEMAKLNTVEGVLLLVALIPLCAVEMSLEKKQKEC